MPLICEAWSEAAGEWIEISQLAVGDAPFSLTLVEDRVPRRAYVFQPDRRDEYTGIYVGEIHETLNAMLPQQSTGLVGITLLRRLKDGDEPEVFLALSGKDVPTRYRVRHVAIRFGVRVCQICGEEHTAWRIGTHLATEHKGETHNWPGGNIALLRYLVASVEESIEAAEGFPGVVQRLTVTHEHLLRHLGEYIRNQARNN